MQTENIKQINMFVIRLEAERAECGADPGIKLKISDYH